MQAEEVMVILCGSIILAGVVVLWMAMQNRRQIREMEHRERLAMIERGLVPAPEVDPEQFERKMAIGPARPGSAARYRTTGVIMIGLGLALMMIIGFAAQAPEVGVGIGGAFAVLGAAFVFNGMLQSRNEPLAARPGVYLPAQPKQPAAPQTDRLPEP